MHNFTRFRDYEDGSVSQNQHKAATNHAIHEKSQNLYEMAQLLEEKKKFSLYVKFFNNLKVP